MTCRELNMIVGELDTIYDGDSDEASCNDGHQETCVWKIRLTGLQAVIAQRSSIIDIVPIILVTLTGPL